MNPKILSKRGDREDQVFEAFRKCRAPEIAEIGKQTVHYSADDDERDVDKTIGKMRKYATLEADKLQSVTTESDNESTEVTKDGSIIDSDDSTPNIFSDHEDDLNRASGGGKLIEDITQQIDDDPKPSKDRFSIIASALSGTRSFTCLLYTSPSPRD